MPVILTTAAEVDLWLWAETPDALELQRLLPDDARRDAERALDLDPADPRPRELLEALSGDQLS